MSEIKRARALATAHHAGILDRSGKPYIIHPARVAAAVEVEGGSTAAIAAAWLHDVLEEAAADGTRLTAAHLRAAGISPEAIEAIEAVTKLPTETYFEFIARSAENELGLIIKIADLTDNMDPERGGFPGHASLMVRYAKAMAILEAKGLEILKAAGSSSTAGSR